MSSTVTDTAPDATVAALEKCLGPLAARGPGAWMGSLQNGNVLQVLAEVQEDWLLLVGRLQGPSCPWPKGVEALSPLLEQSARLEGGVRWAVTPGERTPHLRADIRRGPARDLAGRLSEVCSGFRSAAHAEAEKGPKAVAAADAGQAGASAAPADPERLCREAGWECRRRPDGLVTVNLEVEEAFYQATVAERSPGRLAAARPRSLRQLPGGRPVRRAARDGAGPRAGCRPPRRGG